MTIKEAMVAIPVALKTIDEATKVIREAMNVLEVQLAAQQDDNLVPTGAVVPE